MAIGWMTILSNVPWSEVIKNAPVVADGARKLWNKVGGKGTASESAAPVPTASPEERLAELQARVDALHAQMLTASEVIASLAEQNAQLVARIESNRRRTLALLIINIGVAGLALTAWLN
ncbi:MAG: hypothetical protein LDL29_06560 [Dechloromonas sp.]|nr:hypothetical protein [Dechloromonas sp.]